MPDLRLGLNLGYSGAQIQLPMDMVQEADRLGFYAVWTAESYGSDSVTPLAWIGALTQRIHLGTEIMHKIPHHPANVLLKVLTLHLGRRGRMLLGLGLSGPQVVEGWHGQPYGKPLVKTREYVAIVRAILERKRALTGELLTQQWAIFAGEMVEKLALADQLGADQRKALRLRRQYPPHHLVDHPVAPEKFASCVHSAPPCCS